MRWALKFCGVSKEKPDFIGRKEVKEGEKDVKQKNIG